MNRVGHLLLLKIPSFKIFPLPPCFKNDVNTEQWFAHAMNCFHIFLKFLFTLVSKWNQEKENIHENKVPSHFNRLFLKLLQTWNK